jgi:putative ABC transport system permease protein
VWKPRPAKGGSENNGPKEAKSLKSPSSNNAQTAMDGSLAVGEERRAIKISWPVFLDLIFTALKQVSRNRRRYRGAFISTAVGIAGLAALTTLSSEVENQVSMNLELLGSATIIKAEWDFYSAQRWRKGEYNLEQVKGIQSLEGVVDASAAVWKSKVLIVRNKKKFKARLGGVQAGFFRVLYLPCSVGRHFAAQEVKERRSVCVIGRTISRELFPDLPDPVGKTIMVENIPFKIICVLGGAEDPEYKETILIPLTVAQSRIQGLRPIHDIYVRAKDWYVAKEAHERVKEFLKESRPSYAKSMRIKYYRERIKSILTIVYILKLFLLAAVIAVLLIGALAVANLMAGVVAERTPEIGLRIAMGATGRLILSQFLIESLVVGVVGAILGVAFGVVLIELVVSIMGTSADYALFIRNAFLSLIVGVSLGVAAGFIPARKAGKMTCVEALRYE